MLAYKKIDLADNERAFLFKKKRFSGILKPGSYRFIDPMGDIRVGTRQFQDLLERIGKD